MKRRYKMNYRTEQRLKKLWDNVMEPLTLVVIFGLMYLGYCMVCAITG